MAKQNAYLARRQALDQAIFSAGENLGYQKLWDMVQIVLNDPEYMGKDTFSKKRMSRVYEGLKFYTSAFANAFSNEVDADICQRDIDAKLDEIWGDELVPFYERYPDLKKIDYNKSKKGWV